MNQIEDHQKMIDLHLKEKEGLKKNNVELQ